MCCLFILSTVYKNCLAIQVKFPGGGGNDTPGLRVPAARIFKELPCFGVKFSNIHPASESDFLSGIFGGNLLLCKFLLLC